MAQYGQSTVVVATQPAAPTTTVIVQKKEPNPCRAAIPSMHIAMAIICLILNILLPGIGTIVAGFAVFCCGNRGQTGGGKFGTFCLNFWVGLLQLLLATIFFIGWIWAIIWGVVMITLSDEYHNPPADTTTVVNSGAPASHGVVVTSSSGIQQQQQQQGYIQHPPPQGYAQPPPPQGYGQQPPPQGYAQPPPQPMNPYPPNNVVYPPPYPDNEKGPQS